MPSSSSISASDSRAHWATSAGVTRRDVASAIRAHRGCGHGAEVFVPAVGQSAACSGSTDRPRQKGHDQRDHHGQTGAAVGLTASIQWANELASSLVCSSWRRSVFMRALPRGMRETDNRPRAVCGGADCHGLVGNEKYRATGQRSRPAGAAAVECSAICRRHAEPALGFWRQRRGLQRPARQLAAGREDLRPRAAVRPGRRPRSAALPRVA